MKIGDSTVSQPNITDFGGFYDRSCANFRDYSNLYWYPFFCCNWHRHFCLGKCCDSYEIKFVPKTYVQLTLFDDYV